MANLKAITLKASSVASGHEMTVYPVLITDGESAVLVDSSYPGHFEILKNEIEKHIDINKLKALVITHHDFDHIGTAKEFKNLLGDNLKIYATDVEAEYISGAKMPLKLQKLGANKENLDEGTLGFYNMLSENFPKLYINVDETFKAGDVLPLFDGIQTIDTPGHTLGHICLYIKEDKSLITGDTLAIEDGKLSRINDFYNYDVEQAKESIKKLADFDIELVRCYHGGDFVGKLNMEELTK